MKIAKDSAVSIDYVLKDDNGNIVDSSKETSPLEFLCGYDNIIPGLEKVLIGKSAGESFSVSINPEEGYGDYDSTLIQTVKRKQIESDDSIEIGVHFQVDTPEGPMIYTVIKIEGDDITLDGNHPLAGQNLHFEIEIKNVRESTEEERQYGHIHSGDSCN